MVHIFKTSLICAALVLSAYATAILNVPRGASSRLMKMYPLVSGTMLRPFLSSLNPAGRFEFDSNMTTRISISCSAVSDTEIRGCFRDSLLIRKILAPPSGKRANGGYTFRTTCAKVTASLTSIAGQAFFSALTTSRVGSQLIRRPATPTMWR